MSFFESTLLHFVDPCRNWTIERLARKAEKKERDGAKINKYDTR